MYCLYSLDTSFFAFIILKKKIKTKLRFPQVGHDLDDVSVEKITGKYNYSKIIGTKI